MGYNNANVIIARVGVVVSLVGSLIETIISELIPYTTGEAIFPECHILPRVPKIGHSGNTGTRGRPSSPSATLGEDGHTKKKSCI
jgi:hypothetical protein